MTPYQARRLYFFVLSCLKGIKPLTVFKDLSPDTMAVGQKGVKCATMLTNPDSRGEFYRQFTRRFGNRILKERNEDTEVIVNPFSGDSDTMFDYVCDFMDHHSSSDCELLDMKGFRSFAEARSGNPTWTTH